MIGNQNEALEASCVIFLYSRNVYIFACVFLNWQNVKIVLIWNSLFTKTEGKVKKWQMMNRKIWQLVRWDDGQVSEFFSLIGINPEFLLVERETVFDHLETIDHDTCLSITTLHLIPGQVIVSSEILWWSTNILNEKLLN